jgi:cobalt-zinc-cadmium efflux system membrane fusion protein
VTLRPMILVGLVLGFTACGDASSDVAKAPSSRPTTPASEPGVVTIAPDSPQLGQIRVAPVEVADVPQEDVVAPARIGIDPSRLSKVLMPVPGRIEEVRVKLGDHVERGQAVATLESPDADVAVGTYRQAEAAERQAEAALTKAEADYQRARELREHGAVAQKDLLAAENDRAQAQGALATARATREQARRKLELLGLEPTSFRQRVVVRAPLAGKVLEVSVAPGEYRNDTSAALMSIADLSRVWISADVAEPAIGLIRVGEAVAITLVAFPEQDFSGRVTRIADVLDPQTRTVKVHVELANPDGRLRPDMFGSIRHAGPQRRVPLLPTAAVVQQYGRAVVFVERAPGRFERREVLLGARTGERVAVLKGIEPGERVVLDGAILLKDR